VNLGVVQTDAPKAIVPVCRSFEAMDLVGPSWNPAVKRSWEELAAILAEIRDSGAPIRRAKRVSQVRPRGQVRGVIAKLLEANGTMRAKQIHLAVESELGESVQWSSIANCLRENSQGERRLFKKVGHGRYQLA
jgi:hypothetical protein